MEQDNTKLPPAFISRIKRHFPDEADELLHAINQPQLTAIRLNPAKRISQFSSEQKVPWCEEGFLLASRPSFTLDPLFHSGCYYVQESSSMFLEIIFNQVRKQTGSPLHILDACAAPGGKSTHLLSLMDENDLLVSNEVIASRVHVLMENVIKWGNDNFIITQNELRDFSRVENYFDIVVLDAPCSGEGLFRKDKNAIDEWSEKNVEFCAARQKKILHDILPCIKPGGFLIYSTCTYEPEENEMQVLPFIEDGRFVSIKVDFDFNGSGIMEVNEKVNGYYFLPHKVDGSGFFISCLQKNGEQNARPAKFKSSALKEIKPNASFSSFLKDQEAWTYFERGNNIAAIKQSMVKELNYLSQHLKTRLAGINLGEKKGNDFIPSHQLALSQAISTSLPTVDLEKEEALSYLRCNSIPVKGMEKGYHLVQHLGFNLGWIKALESRTNNLYPREWRVRK